MPVAQLVENVLQALTAGLLIGAIYGLMCVGLALIFGVMRVINFAQGDFMMLGMYAAFYFFTALGVQGRFRQHGRALRCGISGRPTAVRGRLLRPPNPDLAGSGTDSATRGRRTLRPAHSDARHCADPAEWRPDRIRLHSAFGAHAAVEQRLENRPLWDDLIEIFVNKCARHRRPALACHHRGLAVLIARSRLGKSLRAAADNPTAATYMGIDVDLAHRIAFALGIGITAIAGGLLATNYPFHPFVGLEYVIVMYAGVVLGGMGSIIGAFWGGMTIGLVQQLSTLILPTQLQNTAIFVVFLLIVFFRPQGFFGRMVERT